MTQIQYNICMNENQKEIDRYYNKKYRHILIEHKRALDKYNKLKNELNDNIKVMIVAPEKQLLNVF